MDGMYMNLLVETNETLNDIEMMIRRQNHRIQDTFYELNEDWFTTEQLTIAESIKSKGKKTAWSGLSEEKKRGFLKAILKYRYCVCGGNLRTLLIGDVENDLVLASKGNDGTFSKRYFCLPLPDLPQSKENGLGQYKNWASDPMPISKPVRLLLRMN